MNNIIDNKSIKRIPPLHDVMFSTIFANMESAEAAKSLINAVLLDAGREAIDEIKSLSCQEVLPGSYAFGKGCRLDVAASAAGHLVDVEVQLQTEKRMIDRSYFYSTRMLAKGMQSGQSYDKMPKISLINILGFTLRDNHADFHQPVALTYLKGEPEQATDILHIHNLELPKFRQLDFDKTNALHRWLFYFDRGYETPNDPAVREVLTMDTGLMQFAEKYKISLDDPDFFFKYNQYIMAMMDENTKIARAIDQGKAEGKAEGESEGVIKSLAAACRAGVPRHVVEKMAKEIGISLEQTQQLYAEIQAEQAKDKGREM